MSYCINFILGPYLRFLKQVLQIRSQDSVSQILSFVLLLIVFLVCVTYHDFARTYHGLIPSYVTLLTVTFYRGSIPALLHGLLSTAAVIISLNGRDLDGIRGRQTRLSGKPIFHRRCRGPIVLKIAVKLRLGRRETMR